MPLAFCTCAALFCSPERREDVTYASHSMCHCFQLPHACFVPPSLTCHAPSCCPALRCAVLCCSPERREDVTYAGNYLVFGHGPHYCVGKEYANNHLIAFLAILSTSLDWTRFRCVLANCLGYVCVGDVCW
jgi:cytochrome P450 family 710 subfamily A protein